MSSQTLRLLDERLEREQDNGFRFHGGASRAGNECQRAFWYDFRWATAASFDAGTLRKFRSGHQDEDTIADELSSVVVLTGRQASFRDGHLGGSVDGIISAGLTEGQGESCIWEHKSVGEKYFEELERLAEERRASGDNEEILNSWRPQYFAQAQIYMHYFGLHRHFLTVSTGGARKLQVVITSYNKTAAEEYIDRAHETLSATDAPRRIGEWDSFSCRFCTHAAVCHGNTEPHLSCRSCRFAIPTRDGNWTCAAHGRTLDEATQRVGCQVWARFSDH